MIDTRRYDDVDYNGCDRNSNARWRLAGATLALTGQLTRRREPRLRRAATSTRACRPAQPAHRRVAHLVGDAADHGDRESADDARRFRRRRRLGRIRRALLRFDVAHELTHLHAARTASWSGEECVGVTQRDSTTAYGLRAEYHVSRELVLKADASRQLYESNAAKLSITSPTLFMLGLKLQR